MKRWFNRRMIVFWAVAVALAIRSTPTNEQKQAAGLRLSIPVETPTGVHLSWTGGQAGVTYSLYRLPVGVPGATWERIALGLEGVSGAYFFPSFTLDATWAYRIQAEVPE